MLYGLPLEEFRKGAVCPGDEGIKQMINEE